MPKGPPRRLGAVRRVVAAALLVGSFTATATSAGSLEAAAGASAPQEFAPGDPAFFTVPDPIPAGEHGDLLRFQVVDTPFYDTYRIMYLSTTVSGAPTVVTGLVAAREERAPFGGYPLVLHGHGTVGIADQCAPSRAIEGDSDGARDFDGAARATNEGWAVVSTDFEGLGGPGRHPFLVGVSAARSMLDGGRAARQVPGLYLSATTGLVGFSQGGHAALWARQLAAEWTPEQQIVGTVLAAPASDPGFFASRGASEPSTAPLTVSILGGLAASYPEAEAALPNVLTPAGLELLGLMDQHCFDEPVAMPGGDLLRTDPTTVEPFAPLLAANTAGLVPAPTPVLTFHGDQDVNVPFAMSDVLLERMCASGQIVERRVIPGGMHAIAPASAYGDGITWLTGLADQTTTPISSCPG